MVEDEQRYEYTVVSLEKQIKPSRQLGDKLNEYAADGWRLVERIDMSGSTTAIVFERPISNGDRSEVDE